jgi:hypothetical protein
MNCVSCINETVQSITSTRSTVERRHASDGLRKKYELVLYDSSHSAVADKIMTLRKLVLSHGLPDETDLERTNCGKICSLRADVWKILLGALYMDSEQYIADLEVSDKII